MQSQNALSTLETKCIAINQALRNTSSLINLMSKLMLVSGIAHEKLVMKYATCKDNYLIIPIAKALSILKVN